MALSLKNKKNNFKVPSPNRKYSDTKLRTYKIDTKKNKIKNNTIHSNSEEPTSRSFLQEIEMIRKFKNSKNTIQTNFSLRRHHNSRNLDENKKET
jgi:hypothetical protein